MTTITKIFWGTSDAMNAFEEAGWSVTGGTDCEFSASKKWDRIRYSEGDITVVSNDGVLVGKLPKDSAEKMRNLKVEGEGIIDAMRNLLKSGQAKKINGMLVDFYSASMVVQTYDAVSQATKDKILKMDVERMVASVYAANSAARKTP